MGLTEQELYSLRTDLLVISTQIDRLADLLFEDLFAKHPDLESLFPADMREHKKKFLNFLGQALTEYSGEAGRAPIADLAHRHRNYGVSLQDYEEFGQSLLYALQRVAPERWTPALETNWSLFFSFLADRMINASAHS